MPLQEGPCITAVRSSPLRSLRLTGRTAPWKGSRGSDEAQAAVVVAFKASKGDASACARAPCSARIGTADVLLVAGSQVLFEGQIPRTHAVKTHHRRVDATHGL